MFFFYSKFLLLLEHKLSDKNGWTLFICKTLYGEKNIYIAYILYVCFGISKKTLSAPDSQIQPFETLETLQHFAAHDSDQ